MGNEEYTCCTIIRLAVTENYECDVDTLYVLPLSLL